MSEINWVVTLLLGAIISIPVSIFANIITPKFQDWMTKWSLSSRGKSVERLQSEYNKIKYYQENPSIMQNNVNSALISGVYGLILFALTALAAPLIYFLYITRPAQVAADIVMYVFIFIGAILGIFSFFKVYALALEYFFLTNDLKRINNFKEYETKTLSRIKELQQLMNRKSKKQL